MTRAAIDRFYERFGALDAEGMVAQYAADVVFWDPVFGALSGRDAGDMWRMLCASATDLTIEHTVDHADEHEARVRWVATYTFPATGRAITNRVTALMRFDAGRIVDHRDSFSFWKWSSQALGPTGRLLGWSPIVQNKVRSNAKRGLEAFQARQP